MSNPTDLSLSRSLEAMTSLQSTATAFAAKEATLLKESSIARVAQNRRLRQETEALETWLSSETSAVASHYSQAESSLRAKFEQTKARIQLARKRRLDNLQALAKSEREKWLWNLQMRHFNGKKAYEHDLKCLDDDYAAFCADVAAAGKQFDAHTQRMRAVFRGFPVFKRLLRSTTQEQVNFSDDHVHLLAKIQTHLAAFSAGSDALWRAPTAQFFRFLPLDLSVPLAMLAGAGLGFLSGNSSGNGLIAAAGAAGGALVFLLLLHHSQTRKFRPLATQMAQESTIVQVLLAHCQTAADRAINSAKAQLRSDFDALCSEVTSQRAQADEVEAAYTANSRQKMEVQTPRLLEKARLAFEPKLASCLAARDGKLAEIHQKAETWHDRIHREHADAMTALASDEDAKWSAIQSAWNAAMGPLYSEIQTMNDVLAPFAKPWDAQAVETWMPAAGFPPGAKFADIHLDLSLTGIPSNASLALPGPSRITIPLALTFPSQGSLIFETPNSGSSTVIDTINAVILRLLATIPPGKLAFTILDPVGLGQNFAGIMHLSDYEEAVINRKIWTQHDQIDERLGELNEHIEKVIQMYLRNEYANITEYNAQADSVAEKYHFLVVADFPSNFSEMAAKRIQSIAASGARCGVFTLIHWDRRLPVPDGLVPEELRKSSVCLRQEQEGWTFVNEAIRIGKDIAFDAPPSPDLAVELIHRIGRSSIDSNRVEVPFSQISPTEDALWTHNTTSELKIAIGRTGATKLQYLAIGKGTRQHALFAGKTGSGKSTLFHVIITNLALACSPDQVEFYLIDFKKGVEFKCYANQKLPHAKVIAIESDREFGLSVLRRVDEELKRRGDLFRAMGVQDIAGYKKAGGTEPIPRSLLIIDEFQEFFVVDDEVAQAASLLFDRIVRQGRAFGIHVLLGSQTLGGAYTLARATLGQMAIRVALQCNEADAYLIMDDNNPAPRLLSRPGEGIYNDASGALDGNSPFQVLWLSDDERDRHLARVHQLAEERGFHAARPIVFEGNAPADIRENILLESLFDRRPSKSPSVSRAWLGAPNSIKGPTEVTFHRQSGNNLLIVGQNEEATGTMFAVALLAFLAQHPVGSRYYLFHATNPESPDLLSTIMAHRAPAIRLIPPNDAAEAIADISTELQSRMNGESAPDAPPVFVGICGLHKFKKLRLEDEFDFSGSSDSGPSAGAQLNTLLTEGSSHGIHVLASFDTFSNIGRALSRKALGEFEMRIVFQMSANDSASLIDSPAASTLGLHRAIYYNEREGTLETFRPYAPPANNWFETCYTKIGFL